jgi:hypothetical protein
MPFHAIRLASLFAVALAACALGGCSTVNEKLGNGASDYLPEWAGGLPADAPPRPGSPKYDEWMKERERQRLQPAPPANASTPQAAPAPAH